MLTLSFVTARRIVGRAAVLAAFVTAAGCSENLSPGSLGDPSNPATDTYAASLGVNIAAMTKKSDNLYVQDLVVGSGAEAISGRTLGMVYTGWLTNASQFDSNVGKANFSFQLGAGQVIAGWDQGIVGMKVGGKRKIVIGSTLGYGRQGSGSSIPPNATLVFEVELKTVQ
jgi:FKBP-type peptidyl-prolyl cis-trans isomerase FkpA